MNYQEHLIGGATLGFFERLGTPYGQTIGWTFEPHVAEQTFNDILREARLKVLLGEQVTRVQKRGAALQELECESHHRYAARVFIDSSYEGELMKAAGVSYTVGRESTEE